MSLFYRKYGHGTRNLLILHGLLGSGDNWVSLARRFAETFTVWLPDLRNHGLSPHTALMDYTVMANDIVVFCEANELEKVDVIGHSMGGKVAMVLALKFPYLIHNLVIVDIAAGKVHASANHKLLFEAIRAVEIEAVTNRSEIQHKLFEKLGDEKIVKLLLKNVARGEGGRYHWKINVAVLEATLPEIIGAIPCKGIFTGRTLLITGGQSHYVSEADEALLLDLFPMMTTHTIQDAGHWLHAEAPEAFYDRVLAFLEN